MKYNRKLWMMALSATMIFSNGVLTQTISLQQAIEEAVTHNPDLLEALQEVRAAGAGLWTGISPEYPEFFMEFGGVPESHPWSDYRERKTGLIQTFEFPVTYLFRGKWHHLEKERVQAKYNLLRNRLVSNVKKQFYKVLMLKQKIQIYDDIHQITRENFEKAKIRVYAGESSPYDTLKVKVDMVEVENQVLALRKEYDIAHSKLLILLGRERQDPVEWIGDLSYVSLSLNADSLHALALINHPHLRETRTQIHQNKVNRNLSWMHLIPDFHVKYFRHDLPKESSSNAWGGEIGFSFPLWFLFKGQGKIRTASFHLEGSRWHYIAEKRKVLLEVDQFYSQLLVAEKQVNNYQENTLLEVDELVRIATRSYQEGEMGYLDLAEALRTLNRVKIGYYDALFHYLEARADLEVAVGFDLRNTM